MPKTSEKAKIPRPPNAFIIYRSQMLHSLPAPPPDTTRKQAEVSRLLGEMWRNEAPEVKADFQKRAATRKREHEFAYPGYKYAPRKKETKGQGSMKLEKRSDPTNAVSPQILSQTRPTQIHAFPIFNQHNLFGAPAVFIPGVSASLDYYPPYRNGGAIGFDEMGAYGVETEMMNFGNTSEARDSDCNE
ncbi:hypothetical protein H0H92_011461 [Tricholoma furcatifolium]|nr:hypothetical protein H0H92_011461 [Tricholoma furcatifolium]